jgi:hypothetical protein
MIKAKMQLRGYKSNTTSMIQVVLDRLSTTYITLLQSTARDQVLMLQTQEIKQNEVFFSFSDSFKKCWIQLHYHWQKPNTRRVVWRLWLGAI